MSLDLLVTGINLAWQAWETYEKIEGAPGEVAEAAREIKSMSGYMEDARSIIQKYNIAVQLPSLDTKITEIVKDANAISTEANELFKKWRSKSGTGPFGKLKFTFFGDMETLKQLEGKAKSQSEKLNHQVNLIHMNLYLEHRQGGGGNDAAIKKARSPKPKSRSSDVQILFVDPSNTGRSRVAEALTLLIGTWTVCTGGRWRVSAAHSAGFFVKESPDMTKVVNSANLIYSGNLSMKPGGRPPGDEALAAVFDNKLYDHPIKPIIKKKMAADGSRGLRMDAFARYNYILAFTEREFVNLNLVRDALARMKGATAAADDRGKIVHLGKYLTREEYQTPVEIVNVEGRTAWNAKTSQIKLALKRFLEKELGWEQWKSPPKEEWWKDIMQGA